MGSRVLVAVALVGLATLWATPTEAFHSVADAWAPRETGPASPSDANPRGPPCQPGGGCLPLYVDETGDTMTGDLNVAANLFLLGQNEGDLVADGVIVNRLVLEPGTEIVISDGAGIAFEGGGSFLPTADAIHVGADLAPDVDELFNLGQVDNRWQEIFLQDHIDVAEDLRVTNAGQTLLELGTAGDLDVAGAVTAPFFIGDGSQVANVRAADLDDGIVATSKLGDGAVTHAKLALDSVDGSNVVDASLNTLDLADDAITSAKIGTGQVMNVDLGTDAVTTDKILDATVVNADLAGDAVTSDKILDGQVSLEDLAASSVASVHIVDGSVATVDLGNGVVTTIKIAAGAVTGAELAFSSVASLHIVDGTVATVDLGDASVTSDKIGAGQVASIHLADGTIITADLALDAVTSDRILDGTVATADLADAAVDGAKLAANSVGSSHIVAGSVGSTQLGDAAVTTAKIAAGAVTGAELAFNAVTTDHIVDGTILTADLGDDSVTGSKILEASVSTPQLASGAVTNEKIFPDTIMTDRIFDGGVWTQDLANGAVTAEKLAINSVDSDNVIDGSLVEADHAEASIGTFAIADASILTMDLANNAVDTNKILDGSVGSADLALDSVGSAQIAADAVGSDELAAAAVTSDTLAADAVTSAAILDGTIGAADVNGIEIQHRVTGFCAEGEAIRSIASDGTVVCELDDVTSDIDASQVVSGTLDDARLSSNVALLGSAQAFAAQQTFDGGVAVNGILDVDGDVQWTGELTSGAVPWARLTGHPSVVAGSGLTGGGDLSATRTLAVDTTTIQSRVTGTCGTGFALGAVNGDGTVFCNEVGQLYDGSDFALSDNGCAVGEAVVGIDAAGFPVCTPNPTYSGADFAFSGQGCAIGDVVFAIDGSGAVVCAAVEWSSLAGVPSGFADGVDEDTLGALPCAEGDSPVQGETAWVCGVGGTPTGVTGGRVLYGQGDAAVRLTPLGPASICAGEAFLSLYLDVDHDACAGSVHTGIVRLTPVETGAFSYAAFTTVQFMDDDLGTDLDPIMGDGGPEITFVDRDFDGKRSPTDPVYADLTDDGVVNEGDYRWTGADGYTAGTVVFSGDTDAGDGYVPPFLAEPLDDSIAYADWNEDAEYQTYEIVYLDMSQGGPDSLLVAGDLRLGTPPTA